MSKKLGLIPGGPIDSEHWYNQSPILIEALAEAVDTTITDVCEHLEANCMDEQIDDEQAVALFLNEYVAA